MQEKPKLKEAIIVEGKYDKIKLSSILEALIIVTNGFSVFQNQEMLTYIKKIADINGIVILTDSDRAGFLIRNYIKQGIEKEKVKQAYIPDIFGKEKRKSLPSKAGTLGVEGMEPQIIINALKSAGCTFLNETAPPPASPATTLLSKADLLLWGLTGTGNSADQRKMICQQLSLPAGLSTNAFLDVINLMFSKTEFKEFLIANDIIKA